MVVVEFSPWLDTRGDLDDSVDSGHSLDPNLLRHHRDSVHRPEMVLENPPPKTEPRLGGVPHFLVPYQNLYRARNERETVLEDFVETLHQSSIVGTLFGCPVHLYIAEVL